MWEQTHPNRTYIYTHIHTQVDCIDTPYVSGLFPPAPPGGAPAVPDTLSGSGARVVLLGGSSTLYGSRLLTWQERLRTLADIGKWKLGMRFALDFYKWVEGSGRWGAESQVRVGELFSAFPGRRQTRETCFSSSILW